MIIFLFITSIPLIIAYCPDIYKNSKINAMIACQKMGACISELLHITKNNVFLTCHPNNQVGSLFCFLWAVLLINIVWVDSCICSSSLAFLDSRLVSFCYTLNLF